MIFEFDNNFYLDQIFKEYENVKILKNSLADCRREYRQFTRLINVEINVLEQCIKSYEYSLLISCYTFAEQLVKNSYYELIEKDSHQNGFLNRFVDSKIPPNKFSPNVKSSNIGKVIKEIDESFKFIITPMKHNIFKYYDEMIRSRHRYAHANNRLVDFTSMVKVIIVLEYINFEFEYLCKNSNLRNQLAQEFKDILILAKNIKKSKHKTIQNPNLKVVRDKSKIFLGKFKNILADIKIFKDVVEELDEVSEFDFRYKSRTNLYYENIDKLISAMENPIEFRE